MNVGGTGAACAVPPTSKAHSAGAAAAAGRSWVSTERPRWTTAAMMAPTIGAKTYNQASLRLPVTIIGPSARAGLEAAPVSGWLAIDAADLHKFHEQARRLQEHCAVGSARRSRPLWAGGESVPCY